MVATPTSANGDHVPTAVDLPHYAQVPSSPFGRLGLSADETTTSKHQITSHHPMALTILTQNVRGYTDSSRSAWLRYFRQRLHGVQPGIVLLQETHVHADDIALRADEFALGWGYRTDSEEAFSVWSAGPPNAAGVAILANPQAKITNIQPWQPQAWSPYFIAVECTHRQAQYTVVNVYGPTDKAAATQLFTVLAKLPRPSSTIILGGDFNACVHDLDRTTGLRPRHRSDALEMWLEAWALADTLSDQLVDEKDADARAEFAAHQHTYYYRKKGLARSARLDRFYLAEEAAQWLVTTRTVVPGAPFDHLGVILTVIAPSNRVQVATPRRTLAKATYVRELQTAGVAELLQQSCDEFTALPDTSTVLQAWDSLKQAAKILCCRIASQARKKQRETYRQRLRTLQRQLTKARRRLQWSEPIPAVADTTADEVAASAEDHLTTVRQLQHRITSIRQQRATHMERRTHNRYRGRTCVSTKAFFSRFSTKYDMGNVYDFEDGGCAPADAVANAWRPIMEAPRRSTEVVDRYFQSIVPRRSLATHHSSSLISEIQVSEVRAALRRSHRGKACGPDGLPNDWYRDHEELLLPFLSKLFNVCLQHAQLPSTFQAANVFCLAKKTNPTSGLDFRPLALLNSDYKIFTRILSTRLRKALPAIVHPNQTGFVPHRSIHSTIALLRAFQDQQHGVDRTQEAAMLLDFTKAYDTLDRAFLVRTLKWLHFPTKFTQLVNALHSGTTASFLLNGLQSQPIQVTSGIRQGCPLAPLLYILAMEPLYRTLELHPDLHGVRLPTQNHEAHLLLVSGYADDTAIYTRDADERAVTTALLDDYGAAAGLRINSGKTILLPAAAQHHVTSDRYAVATGKDIVRYLGVPIMLHRDDATIWHHIQSQLRVRLALALRKTSNVLQRAQLAAAIIVPKLTFVCRHEWPSSAQVADLQRLITIFVWNGHFDKAVRSKSWLKLEKAAKPLKDGGLSLPNLKWHLQALAAATVYQQSQVPRRLRISHSRALPCHQIIQHHRAESTAPKYLSSLFETGVQVLERQSMAIRSDDERLRIATAYSLIDRLQVAQRHWQRERLVVSLASIHERLSEGANATAQEHGRCNAAWLPYCTPSKGALLVCRDGSELAEDQLNLIGNGRTISEIISWQWKSDHTLVFTPVSVCYPLSNHQVRQFDLLVDALISNYPRLILRPHPADLLLVKSEVDVEFHIKEQPGHCALGIREWPLPMQAPKTIHVASQVSMWVKKYDKAAVFATAPQLSSNVQLFLNCPPPRVTYGTIYRQLAHDPVPDSIQEFATVPWQCIHNHPLATSAERLTTTRLKLGRMKYYVSGHVGPICPHAGCESVWADTDHLLWGCPTACTIWDVIWSRWQPLLRWTTKRDLQVAVQQWRANRFPRGWRTKISELDRAQQQHEPKQVLQWLWTAEALAATHAIYKTRVAALNARVQPPQVLEVQFRRTLRHLQWHAQDQQYGAAAKELYALMSEQAPSPIVPDEAQGWLLFFDGGARGNPGPGGAGSVLLRPYLNTYEIAWIGSEYYQPPTTNNYAEFAALRNGVQAAALHRVRRLNVVGDSQLIIKLHQEMRTPRAAHLRVLHDQTVEAMEAIDTITWSHHVREFNKMADTSANWAMDATASSTSTHPYTALSHSVRRHLAGDLDHWAARRFSDSRPTL